jgi:hypothetical protein
MKKLLVALTAITILSIANPASAFPVEFVITNLDDTSLHAIAWPSAITSEDGYNLSSGMFYGVFDGEYDPSITGVPIKGRFTKDLDPGVSYFTASAADPDENFIFTVDAEGNVSPSSALMVIDGLNLDGASHKTTLAVRITALGAGGAGGAAGEAGPAGPAGAAGPEGPSGPSGPVGADGADGADGANGAEGADAPCVDCTVLTDAVVDFACQMISHAVPSSQAELDASIDTIVDTLTLTTNVCIDKATCVADIKAAIDALK